MDDSRIACKINNLKMDRYEAMEVVAEWGIGGVHITATGPFAPEELDKAARKGLVKHVRSLGMEISAIMCWGGQVDLCEEEGWEESVAWGRRLLELAADLECGIWGAHVGVMPWETSDPGWQRMVRAMEQFADHGEKVDACIAIETGPEPPVVIKRLIETVGSEHIRVNYDPANLVIWPSLLAMRRGEQYDRDFALEHYQPVEGAAVLGPYVVHTHAKDALVREDGKYQEVPLGEGWVDWPRYLSNLEEAGYTGYFAIEREVGDDPVGDVRRAVDFLRSL
jgi:L-ribulose-5-phosphate 3-epimerase